MRTLTTLAASLAALLLLAAPALAGEDAWSTDLDAALARARKEGKAVVVDMSSPG